MGHCRLPSGLNGFNSQRASREATAGLARVACAGRDALEASQTGPQHLRPKLANYRRARSAARQVNQCAGSITTEIALWLKGGAAPLSSSTSPSETIPPPWRGGPVSAERTAGEPYRLARSRIRPVPSVVAL